MKTRMCLFLSVFLCMESPANVNYIDISKISNESKHIAAFNYIRENKYMFDHWTTTWNYSRPKEELVEHLREKYTAFKDIVNKSTELYLLLGDISHYLYNLDDSSSYKNAVNNYSLAIRSNPKDFRCYWFIGYHFSLSNVPTEAIGNFITAEKLLPNDHPADFWNDYAWATAVANMPSHSIYAMDKARAIIGKEGSFESQLGPNIRNRIQAVQKDASYKKEEIWTGARDGLITLICRPLGIKVLVDSAWNLSIHDYQKRQTAVIINPAPLKNKKGKEINYTIAVLMKTAEETDKLEDYINKMMPVSDNRKKIHFSDKYRDMVAFELKDDKLYKDIGGGKMHLIGIERMEPVYPGLSLENPVSIPMENSTEVAYYRASNALGRFNGKIFYAIMLDSCGDIDEESLAIFRTFFENQLVIE
jgi:hypothetical protein